MNRMKRVAAAVVGCTALAFTALAGTFPSAVVGFNGPPIDDPGTSQEMFKLPEFSGSTSAYIEPNSAGAFDNNAASRAAGLQTEGAAAMEIFFRWVDPADIDSWVRVSTFNGPLLPNPSLHTDGVVRFNLTNRSQLFQGNVGICLGIRETGVEVPQLDDGGTSGDIEWVGVDTTPNGITAGADGIVDTTAAGDDIQEFIVGTDIVALELPLGTAVISPGPNGTIDTVPAGDDEIRAGFVTTADGGRRPVPQVFLPPSASAVALEYDLTTGNVTVNGSNMGGGFAAFTGNAMLDVVPPRGTLEHIAFVNDIDDTAVLINVGIDELQFEAPDPEPVIPPSVVAPIIADDTEVTVTNLLPTVDQVNLFRDGIMILTQNVADDMDVTFTLPAAAVTDEVYTATQRDSVTGITSNESDGVTVLPEASPYSFSFLLDEDGNGCNFNPPGGWEFMGAGSRVSGPGIVLFPQGRTIFPNSAVWQTLDFRYDDEDNIHAWLGGNGVVDPSPTGLYGMDTIWLTRQPGTGDGPYEVLMDAIQVLDDADNVLITIDDFEGGTLRFSNSRGQSSSSEDVAEQTADASFSGSQSQRLIWSFTTAPGAADDRAALGQLTRFGFSECTTSYQWDATVGTKVRFHMVFRSLSTSALPLPAVVGPVLSTDTSVTVNADAAATSVQLFINGVEAGAPVAPAGGVATFMGLTLNTGDSVSAKQTIGPDESDFAYPQGVQSMLLPPAAPTLESPIQIIDNEVDVSAITGGVDMVEIVDAGDNVIGSTMSINPDGTATITLSRTLVAGELIRARATNVAGSSDSPGFEVGSGNGDIYICIGIRETADDLPLGVEGGTSGPIEWLGAGATISGAPQGVAVSPSNDWQTLIFTPGVDPVAGFTGDGTLSSANGKGTLEHLAVTVNDTSAGRSTGIYQIYVDNVINVGADGGNDFVIADFEAFTLLDESLFQEPTFSGTTAGNLLFPPSASETTDTEGNPGQSQLLTFFFVDTTPGRWVRITTSGATNLSRPVIDLTQPIQLDILMLPLAAGGCPDICGDANCDGVVTVSDIGFFVTAVAQGEAAWNAAFPGGTAPCDFCVNDINGDDFVTVSDIGGFVAAVTNGACQ